MAETLEAWPTQHLGLGLMANYRYQNRSNREDTQMSSGMPKTRLKSRDVITDHWFDLSLTFEQEAYFQWWVKHKIDHGEAFFTIPLHTGAGMNDSAAKFVKIGERRRNGMRYKIACQLVTRYQPATELTEEQLLILLENSTTGIQAGADELHHTIHNQV